MNEGETRLCPSGAPDGAQQTAAASDSHGAGRLFAPSQQHGRAGDAAKQGAAKATRVLTIMTTAAAKPAARRTDERDCERTFGTLRLRSDPVKPHTKGVRFEAGTDDGAEP